MQAGCIFIWGEGKKSYVLTKLNHVCTGDMCRLGVYIFGGRVKNFMFQQNV